MMLDRLLEQGDNGWTLTETHSIGPHKVRAVIYRDSYDFQSRIHVDVWSTLMLQWNQVQSLKGSEHGDLPGARVIRYAEDVGQAAQKRLEVIAKAQPVVDSLLSYAGKILDGVAA